jgi:hypothetical protein
MKQVLVNVELLTRQQLIDMVTHKRGITPAQEPTRKAHGVSNTDAHYVSLIVEFLKKVSPSAYTLSDLCGKFNVPDAHKHEVYGAVRDTPGISSEKRRMDNGKRPAFWSVWYKK